MKRAHLMMAVLVTFGLTAACGPGDRREPADGIGVTTTQETDRRTDTGITGDPAMTQARQITATGCVIEQNNQLMLTQVDAATGVERQPTSFQLVGQTEDVRRHVGQRVQVMGQTMHHTAQMGQPGQPGQPGAPGAQADARDTTAPGADRGPVGTTGEPGQMAGAETLQVSSITPVAGQCPSPGNR
jgi:hypothetical protein